MGFFRNLIHLDAEGNQDYYFNLSFGDYVPIGSIELEYLQSTGTQYINTGIAPDTVNTTVEIKYQYLNNLNTGNDSIIGSRSGSSVYRFYPCSRNGTSKDRMVLGNTTIETPYDTKVHTILFNDGNHDCYLDGELIGNIGTNFTPHSQPMYLFALNCEGNKSYQSASRIYYCKIWKNGELISYMKPCENPDGTYCFYDVVRKERFYNAGTGVFVAMHKTYSTDLPEGYTALDYIVSTGAQYINTGISLWDSNDWISKTTFSINNHKNYNQLFGISNTINTSYDIKTTSNGAYYYKLNNISNPKLLTVDLDTPYTIVHDNTSNVFINQYEDVFNTAAKVTATNITAPIHFGHRLGSSYLEGKIYNLELWKDGYQVRNFIPCLNADGEVGLYDKIGGVFYPSEGDLPFYSEMPETIPIPEEYYEVECLISTGTQYINTGFYPTGDTRYDISFSDCKTNGVLFGAYNNTWTDGYGLYTNAGINGKYWVHYYSNTNTNITSSSTGTIMLDRGVAIINNTSYLVNSNVLSSSVMYPLYLFAGNMDGNVEQPVICNLNYFKIYNSTGMVRDFVPVVRKADKVAGLYDRVSQTFFGNAGTGEFQYTESVKLPDGYTAVSYIGSTGTQYIDTGLVENTVYGVKASIEVTGSPTLWQSLISGTLDNFTLGSTNSITNSSVASLTGLYLRLRTEELFLNRDLLISGQVNEINIQDGIASVNGVQMATYTKGALSTGNGNIYIFNNNALSRYSMMRLYELEFYDENGDRLRHFIPCVDSNETAGLYDIIGNQFYPNNGTGDFIAENTSHLPAGYTKLAYLRSTGTQYIDTGIKPAYDLEIDMTASFEGNVDSSWDCILHAGPGDLGTGSWALRLFGNNSTIQVCYSNYSSTSLNPTVSITPGRVYSIQTGNNYITIDGTTTAGSSNPLNWTPNTSYSMYLFAGRMNGSMWRRVRATIYDLSIWSGGALVRHFIPALNPSNEPGLYDEVSGKFFTNIGSGTFQYEIGE